MLIKGSKYIDERGVVNFNNSFDASAVKRIYTIENAHIDFIRGWQGHAIEKRWFSCIKGNFIIAVIQIDDFEKPSENLQPTIYELDADGLNILAVEAGCVTAIKASAEDSKLLIMADYALNEIKDEYRFPLDYFKIKL
ncbi:cupin domain-containing protein [Elizabethkingia anophelis]|uniref:sugar epimerase n=1 Tax=Elizabethkingia anophelis TaxID=1117645 RepID=UPI00099A02D3|nr:sugar epimerase [Elizabethkingia anophelis]MCT4223080.1 sugar epimerase [Elizabethkingia anophelis]MCT4330849.1 sugar epimerase [Elizabethkingia anophelis]MDV3865668.1 sugar epimerase [Elizabethkingia anophelis]MYY26431.1 sugar epimerase [Elizabethkingia anophelis]OPC46287.1 sugar epimerase [Elizabethkingia anophelis]